MPIGSSLTPFPPTYIREDKFFYETVASTAYYRHRVFAGPRYQGGWHGVHAL